MRPCCQPRLQPFQSCSVQEKLLTIFLRILEAKVKRLKKQKSLLQRQQSQQQQLQQQQQGAKQQQLQQQKQHQESRRIENILSYSFVQVNVIEDYFC